MSWFLEVFQINVCYLVLYYIDRNGNDDCDEIYC
jgi:hypothetical protein